MEIRIARGQPPLQLGRAVANEIGHAWLTQHGTRRPEHDVEEGLCELFAHGWLKQQRTRIADELRRRLRENPDPVYGAGSAWFMRRPSSTGWRPSWDRSPGWASCPGDLTTGIRPAPPGTSGRWVEPRLIAPTRPGSRGGVMRGGDDDDNGS